MARREAPAGLDKLFSIRVAGIPDEITDDQLRNDFRSFGAIADFYRPRLLHKGQLSQYAFVRYFEREHADNAQLDMHGKSYGDSIISVADANMQDSFFTQDTGFITNQMFDTPKVVVEEFDSSLPPEHRSMKRKEQLRNLPLEEQFAVRIDDLSPEISKEELEEIFSSFGEVTSVYYPVDLKTRQSRGFAFVRYANERSADEAVFQMHNSHLDNSSNGSNSSSSINSGSSSSSIIGSSRRVTVRRVRAKTYIGQDESPLGPINKFV